MAISKFTPQSAKKDTGRTIGDNEVAKLANLNRMVDQVNNEFANFNPGGGGLGTLDIITDGNVGGPIAITYNVAANVPVTTGTVSVPVTASPSINFSGGGGYGGGPFTATVLEFPTLTTSADFSVTNTNTLQTLSAPLLTLVTGYNFSFYNNPALTTLNFPLLTRCRQFSFGNTPLLATVNVPLLETVETLAIQASSPGITGFRQSMFPALRTGAFNWGYYSYPSFEIDFPLLTALGGNGINGGSSANLTKINLPALVNILGGNIQVNNINTLTDVTLGTVGTTKTFGPAGYNPYVQFQSCALTQASVDNILTVLASLDGTNGTTASNNGNLYLNGGSNATPSSAGLAARTVLQNRGWYVATN